ESGDQGRPALASLLDHQRDPNKPWKGINGGSRYFTIAAIAIKSSMASTVEEEYMQNLRKKKEGNERKWVSCSDHSKIAFVRTSTDLLKKYPFEIRMGGITIDKSLLSDFALENKKINIYNRMAKQLICKLTSYKKRENDKEIQVVPQTIRVICDQRPVSQAHFDDLGKAIADEISEKANFQEAVSCEPINSKECFMIQMADFLSGMLRQNLERNMKVPGWSELSDKVEQKMFYPPKLDVHKKYTNWTGSAYAP
ncbi:MAG TPA: DUF3800 domain-containing protein, partial [Ignavibacteriaceae bacterium]